MRLKLLFLFLFIFSSFSAHAVIVHYVDENGKIHYVNTEYSKVPAQYQDQVKDQLKKALPKTKGAVKPSTANTKKIDLENNIFTELIKKQKELKKEGNAGLKTALTGPQTIHVDIFVEQGCLQCALLESLLKAKGVQFATFDINRSNIDYNRFHELGGKNVPLTKVGSKLIHGIDVGAIIAAINTQ